MLDQKPCISVCPICSFALIGLLITIYVQAQGSGRGPVQEFEGRLAPL